MANEVIGIDIKVSLEQLKQQLATLGPGMEKEAAAMTAALAKEIKKQERAMRDAAKASASVRSESVKAAGDAAEDAGTKFDKLAKAAGPLGGVLSRVSPEAGAMAATLAGLTSTAEGLAAGLGTTMAGAVGAMSAVLAPAAIAVALLTANMQYEAAQAEASAAAHKSLNEAIQFTKELAAGTADAMLDLKVKVGQLAPEEAAYQKAVKAVTVEFEKQDAATEAAIEARKALGGEWGAEVKGLRDAQAETKKQAEARLLLLAADKEWAAEVRKSAEFVDARDKAAKAASAAEAAAAQQRTADAAAQEEEIARIAAAQDLAYAQTFEHEERKRQEKWATARESVAAAQAEVDAAAKSAEKQVEIAKDQAMREQKIKGSLASSAMSLLASTEDSLMLHAKKMGKENKKAAKDAFAVAQVVASSSAIVNTALAITNALATITGPAAFVAAGAAAVMGGIQVASILAEKPSFHSGGVVGGSANGQGEVSARLLPGEALLNRQATNALGPSGVAALNSGASMGAVSLRIGRLEAREIVRTDVAAGGLIVRTAKSAAASAGNTAGRTGRRPIA